MNTLVYYIPTRVHGGTVNEMLPASFLTPGGSYTSYDMIYLLTAIGLIPGGSVTVHIYTQTINRTTQ